MNDEQILELYFARDEQALVETARKYGGYCFSLASAILPSRQDAEETVSDTYFRAWNTIPPQRPAVLKMFLAKITRNLAFSRWRGLSAGKRGGGELPLVLEELGECVAAAGSVEDRLNARELVDTIRSFLDTLPERDQDLFIRRYFFVEEYDAIARRYGMNAAAVRRSLSRTRAKLKKHLIKEGYAL